MIDFQMVDEMYDRSQTTGVPVVWGLFDKTMLLPLEQLPDAVTGETGERISPQEIQQRAQEGWFDVLHSENLTEGSGGVPLYVPSRIGLFLKLEREGWTAEELRQAAQSEESLVDGVYAADDFAYSDDDLETLILYTRARIDSLESGIARDGSGRVIDQTSELGDERETLGVFETMQESGVPEHLAERVRRDAFRVRALNDCMRVWLMKTNRAPWGAGYGPMVVFKGKTHGPDGFTGDIDWSWTIRVAMAENESGEEPPLRVPAFRLEGGRVVTTRTLRPSEYGERWRELDLDGYLEAWGRLHEEKRCQNCHGELPPDADPRRRFCSERCRNALRQRRYRQRHPEAIERAQGRYWRSLDLDE